MYRYILLLYKNNGIDIAIMSLYITSICIYMEESGVPGGSHYGKILNKFVINVINNELKLKFESGQMKYNTQLKLKTICKNIFL